MTWWSDVDSKNPRKNTVYVLIVLFFFKQSWKQLEKESVWVQEPPPPAVPTSSTDIFSTQRQTWHSSTQQLSIMHRPVYCMWKARLAWGAWRLPKADISVSALALWTQGSMRKAKSLSEWWLFRVRKSGRRSSNFGKRVLSSGRRLVMRERRAFIRFSCSCSTAPTSTIPERSGEREEKLGLDTRKWVHTLCGYMYVCMSRSLTGRNQHNSHEKGHLVGLQTQRP